MKVIDWKAVERRLIMEARNFLKNAYNLELNIPVRVNGRLRSTYGRFICHPTGRIPIAIEMSKNYIKHQDWKTVYETLIHECIHYALFVMNKPYNDGHPVFEREIQKHGSHSTGTIEYRGKVQQYGCPSCDKVFNRSRKLAHNGKYHHCSKCNVRIIYLGEKII
jgi:SprT-like protein